MKKILIITLMVSLVLLCGGSLYAQHVLRLGHLNPQNPQEVATATMAQVFKAMVESGTNEEVKVEIYPGGVLGSERETMEQVRAGVTQSYIASGGGMAAFYPLFSIVEIPFSIADYSVAYHVYDGEFGEELAGRIEEATGFKVLAFGESGGFFQLTNSRRPVHSPADMEGLRVRTMTIPVHMEFMRSLGASPTPIAWAEVYTSLQTGVVDGQHNPIPIIKIGNLEEVQSYLTLTNHMYTPYVWVMNKEWFEGLTEEQQTVINEAARVANLAGRGINRLLESGDDGLPYLAERMEIYSPTDEELQQFRDISIPATLDFIADEFGDEGVELAELYLQAIEQAKEELGL